ncbi:tail fiber domain-containing protein [Dryocola clanedunensis]
MIYNAGTVSISGNMATGTGTNWTAPASQIRTGQTIIVLSNPVQLFQITAINSATSLAVTPAASPALSGQKYGILVTDSLSVDGLAQSISQLINEYDENIGAWESFASTTANQNVTVTINGVSLSIPALGKLAQKGANGAVPLSQGGTGATTAADARSNLGLGYGSVAGTVAQGNDGRLGTVHGKTGGDISGSVNIEGYLNLRGPNPSGGWPTFINFQAGQGNNLTYAQIYQERAGDVTISTASNQTPRYFQFLQNGNSSFPGTVMCVNVQQTSDIDKKENVEEIEDPLSKIAKIRGVTFQWKDSQVPSAGVIAQELMEILPEAIGSVFDDQDQYETVEETNERGETILTRRLVRARDDSMRSYTVEYTGVAALCVEAIKELAAKVTQMESEIINLKTASPGQ